MRILKSLLSFIFQKRKNLKDKLNFAKKLHIIKRSAFFDENYYRKTYNIPQNVEAAKHYLTKGYLCNYNPSPNFNTLLYKEHYKMQTEDNTINPLLLYEYNKEDISVKKEISFPNECISIKKEFSVNPLNKKRLAIFASFSSNGKIHDYVIFYLKGLLEVVDNIIFIADNPLLENEIKKIENLVCFCQAERHSEYDFGSYKRGYEYAKQKGLLENIDDLIFCNDSCVGPIYPFSESFENVKSIKCDYWGLTASDIHDFHIQSYFMVFRKKLIESNLLEKFLSYVKKQPSFENVVFYYETKLTPFLEFFGFESYALFKNYGIGYSNREKGSVLRPYNFIKKCRMPLVKRKALSQSSGYEESKTKIQKTLDFIKKLQPDLNLD